METNQEGPNSVQLLDAAQVAALLGVTKEWVYEASRRGAIPVVRLGRYCRYRPDAIEAWIGDLEGASAMTSTVRRVPSTSSGALRPS
jgi:excisionase family DNA binding protein